MITKHTGWEKITKFQNMVNDYQTEMLLNSPTLRTVKANKIVQIAPQEKDFLYIRNRAVSAGNVIEKKDNEGNIIECQLIPIDEYYKDFKKYAPLCRGCNSNGDFFAHEELLKTYKSFIGSSVFIDHDDDNVEKARGIILDAIYNQNGYFVELLLAIDKKAFPQLANGIEKKYLTGTSMGCRCEYAICSICGHKAYSDEDVCEHIQNYKGTTYNGLPVHEDNRGVVFFEDSIVTTPADPDARILERVASKKNNRAGIFTPTYFTKKENIFANETNQRIKHNKINSLADQLRNLWD